MLMFFLFFFSSRRRHTRWNCDWSSDVCSSDLPLLADLDVRAGGQAHVEGEAREAVLLVGGNAAAVAIALLAGHAVGGLRSEERRVGKECRSRWSRYHYKKNKNVA